MKFFKRLREGFMAYAIGALGLGVLGLAIDVAFAPWAYNLLGSRNPAGLWTTSLKGPQGEAATLTLSIERIPWYDGRETESQFEGRARYCASTGASWSYEISGRVTGWLGREARLKIRVDPSSGPVNAYRLGEDITLVWTGGQFSGRGPWVYVEQDYQARGAKKLLKIDDPRMRKVVDRINSEPDPHPELQAPAVFTLRPVDSPSAACPLPDER